VRAAAPFAYGLATPVASLPLRTAAGAAGAGAGHALAAVCVLLPLAALTQPDLVPP
jgi:hypothetical protein